MMNMKKICFFMLLFSTMGYSQSKVTQKLQEQNSDGLVLFFYNNTLRMINQKDDQEFDDLIRDIEKMKFLMIGKKEGKVLPYQKLVQQYKDDDFEEAMTSRFEGKNFDIFVKEKNGKTKGMLVLVNSEESLFVLDIVGKIALNKVTKLYSTLDGSTEIGKKIKDFMKTDDQESNP